MKTGIIACASISALADNTCFWDTQTGIFGNSAPLAKVWELQLPELKNTDKVSRMAALAALLATQGELLEVLQRQTTGICMGSSRGATETFERLFHFWEAEGKLPPYTSPMTTLGNIASTVAKTLQLQGPLLSHSSTCSTGLQAIGNAIAWLHAGMAEVFLAGAAEAPLTDFTLAQMKALKIYTQEPESPYPCKPLSVNALHSSMVLGEAASVLCLEKYKSGNTYLAVIEDYGNVMDHQVSATGISVEGFYLSMKQALRNTPATEIDLVLMHAPGTIIGDQTEIEAIQKIWKAIPVYSLKWQTGHSLAASALLSIQLAIEIFKKQRIPIFPYPTRISNPPYKKIEKILINAAGFGGNISSILLSKSN